ncbi:MAG: hypothetical protein KKD28_09335 [Chloroflexi bacterium]|nr:hypothetical protein [Chloroflexota bacterium]MBU1661661.1 hypothetical protein [Chloroflexota bacterium]
MLVHGLADGFTHGNQSDGYPCAATTQDECVASEGISSGGIRVRVRRRCKPVAAEAQMTFF